VILKNVNIHIHCGELTVIIGKNGAGKSTLLKAILGEIPHTGEITFLDMKENSKKKIKIGYVPQSINVERHMPTTVYDMFASYISDVPVCFKKDKKIYDEFSDFRYKFLFQKMQQLTAFIKDINNLEDSNALEKLIKDNLCQILGASFVELEIADENFEYKGLHLKQIDDLKIFNLNELKENLKGSCDSLACIKINETNLDVYLYILIGLKAMDALEQKEILYMLSLVKEVLSPVLLQFERYNEAMSNYRHDQLTHVYNRYGLDYIIKEQFNHANMLYLLMIDIDNFKHINDTYGHEAGDEILVKIASTLSNCLGNKNVARIGGEEFIGLIPSNNKDIKDKLDDIMNNVRSIKFQKETISISIGVSKMLSPNDFKEAKLEADRKLYVAKNSGKNKYVS